MPTYRVRTDQGTFAVRLDREPASETELRALVEAELSGGRSAEPAQPSAPASGPSLVGAALEAPGVAIRTFAGGFGRMKEAVAPSAGAPPRSPLARALEFAGGLGDVVSLGVPAAVGHVTGAAMERLVRASGELTDAALRARRAQIARVEPQSPELGLIDRMLALPYEERVARARAGGAAQGEFLGGFAPVGAAVGAAGRLVRRVMPGEVPAVGSATPPAAPPRLALPPAGGSTVVGPPRRFEAGPMVTGEVVELVPLPPAASRPQPATVAEVLREVPGGNAPLTQRESVARTLAAAEELAAGRRPLDLGEIGRRRLATPEGGAPSPAPPPPAPEPVAPDLTVRREVLPRTVEAVRPLEAPPLGRARLVEPPLTPAQAATGISEEAVARGAGEGLPLPSAPTSPRARLRFGPEGARPLPEVGPVEELPRPAPQLTGASGPPPLTDPILALPTSRRIVAAAEELFTKAGVPRDPTRLLSDQITDLLAKGALPLPEVQATLARNGLTLTQLANDLFRPGVRDAARRLQSLSALEQRLKGLAQSDPEAQRALGELRAAAADLDEVAKAQDWWVRVDNLRRGLLVSQLATAVRNFETQVGRLGLDVLQRGLDAGLQQLFRGAARTHPADGFEAVLNLFGRGTKERVEAVLRAFPAEQNRLFLRFSSDIASSARAGGVVLSGADRAFQRAEQAVELLNTVNRFQEFVVRRAVFQAELAQRLRRRGQDLAALIEQNRVGTIPAEDVRAAVDKALEMTFATQPTAETFGPRFGAFAERFISLVNDPIARRLGSTLLVPFPRFLMNSLKFFYDFSPLGALRLLSPRELAALRAGDTQVASRAILGTAMLGAAWQLRNSEWAGERWYEVRVGDTTLDLRPFNPFAAYLFVADVAKRKLEGRLDTLSTRDIAQGVLSANLRAGTGLFIIDKILAGVTETGSAEKALEALKGLAGEVIGGFAVPFQQVTDALAQFDDSLRVVRDTRSAPLTGPFRSRIPGLAQTLPEAESPTREGPILREAPLLRQLTGVNLRSKNPLERELDRLGFTRPEILPSTGDPEADRLIAQKMGPIAERLLGRVVEAPGFQRLPDSVKAEALRQGLARVRQAARQQAEAENPRLFQQLRLQRLPRRQRAVLEELGAPSP
jgi:hypothetical protein